VDGGVGGEGIEFDPHIHIALGCGFVAGCGAEQADALQLVALLPNGLVLTKEG
jgi:hypothetical protein